MAQECRKVAVAGATGRVGRPLVEVLKTRGYEVVPMSRASGVDVTTGEGLANALSGVDCIIDTSSSPSPEQRPATEFFVAAARNLHAAGKQAGVRRLVVISIIGIDRFTGGYNAAKVTHEKAVLAGPIPVRILRAAQFHELVGQFVEWGRHGELSYIPRMRTQLVAATTVAEALADLATGPWASSGSSRPPFPEIAGPRAENLVDLAKLLVDRRRDPVRIEGVSNSADPDHGLYESGALLPGPGATLAGPTFEQWLASVR
ncbi:MAG: SDR family oxidoreductase [Myxococcaceae bacterium]